MDLNEPSAAVVPSLDGPVLMVLARTTLPLSARAVARLSGRGSPAGVNKVLQRLVAHGLVSALEAEPAVLYTLNRLHLAAPAVESLVDLRNEFIRRLRESISAWVLEPAFASLFGSAARGDGDLSGDIDLFLIRPKGVDLLDRIWHAQVGKLARDVHDWTGNHASMAEFEFDEITGPGRESIAAFVAKVRAEWVPLLGTVPPELDALSG